MESWTQLEPPLSSYILPEFQHRRQIPWAQASLSPFFQTSNEESAQTLPFPNDSANCNQKALPVLSLRPFSVNPIFHTQALPSGFLATALIPRRVCISSIYKTIHWGAGRKDLSLCLLRYDCWVFWSSIHIRRAHGFEHMHSFEQTIPLSPFFVYHLLGGIGSLLGSCSWWQYVVKTFLLKRR